LSPTALPASELAPALARAGVLVPTCAPGVYVQDARFEAVVQAVARAVRAKAAGAERLRFAPVMPRADLRQLGYFRSFPHLLGSVHCFCGDEVEHRALLRAHNGGADWSGADRASDLVLTPAACYPLYAALAGRGAAPPNGWTVEVQGACFRREPSDDPARMQSFSMQEVVHVGAPLSVLTFRDDWVVRAENFLIGLGLSPRVEIASDPFFGRAAAVLKRAQRTQALKYELKLPVSSDEHWTACVSANLHLDGFTNAVGLEMADGEIAHSACVGFGLERVALALFRTFGVELDRWPEPVRTRLAVM
jgi:seryl-tRNA synthetase